MAVIGATAGSLGAKAATSAFPWASAGAAVAYPFLQKLFPGSFGKGKTFKGLDPASFKDELVVGESDLGAARTNLQRRATKGASGIMAGIKQAGATGRLPKSVTQTHLADVGTNISEGLAGAEPGFQNLKRQSLMDFINAKNKFDMNKMNANNQNVTNVGGGTLSSLSRIFDLYRSGAFNKEPIPPTTVR